MTQSSLKGRDRLPDKAVQDIKSALGPDLESLIVYGSAVGDEFVSGLSDINLLLVVTEAGLDRLISLAPLTGSWRKKGIAPPLIVTKTELNRSLDAFPLEYLNIKLAYEVVEGGDPLAEIDIAPDDLRLQCEREVQGKLILLRQALIDSSGRENELAQTALGSIKAFVAIFRGVLHLAGQNPAGLTAAQVLEAGAARLGLADRTAFGDVWKLRQTKKKPPRGEVLRLFKRYLAAVTEAAGKVDALATGN